MFSLVYPAVSPRDGKPRAKKETPQFKQVICFIFLL